MSHSSHSTMKASADSNAAVLGGEYISILKTICTVPSPRHSAALLFMLYLRVLISDTPNTRLQPEPHHIAQAFQRRSTRWRYSTRSWSAALLSPLCRAAAWCARRLRFITGLPCRLKAGAWLLSTALLSLASCSSSCAFFSAILATCVVNQLTVQERNRSTCSYMQGK